MIQLQITVCGIHSDTCCNTSTWKVEAQRTEHLRPTWPTHYTVAQVGLKLQIFLSQPSIWWHYISGFMKIGPEKGKKGQDWNDIIQASYLAMMKLMRYHTLLTRKFEKSTKTWKLNKTFLEKQRGKQSRQGCPCK